MQLSIISFAAFAIVASVQAATIPYKFTSPVVGAILSPGEKIHIKLEGNAPAKIDIGFFRVPAKGAPTPVSLVAKGISGKNVDVRGIVPNNTVPGRYFFASRPAGTQEKPIISDLFTVVAHKTTSTDVKEYGWTDADYWGTATWW